MMYAIKFLKSQKKQSGFILGVFSGGNKDKFVPFKEYCLAKQNLEL